MLYLCPTEARGICILSRPVQYTCIVNYIKQLLLFPYTLAVIFHHVSCFCLLPVYSTTCHWHSCHCLAHVALAATLVTSLGVKLNCCTRLHVADVHRASLRHLRHTCWQINYAESHLSVLLWLKCVDVIVSVYWRSVSWQWQFLPSSCITSNCCKVSS